MLTAVAVKLRRERGHHYGTPSVANP